MRTMGPIEKTLRVELRTLGVSLCSSTMARAAVDLARRWDADPGHTEPDTVALRAINDRVAGDERVEVAILPAFDGLTIARKL